MSSSVRYPVAKAYFFALHKQFPEVENFAKVVAEYEKLKEIQGEFLAARYLIEVYKEIPQELKEVANG